jgi:hypothetical protein
METDELSPPVDIVYTWVNGSDANFTAVLEDFARLHTVGDRLHVDPRNIANKFREHDELRHSLRSVHMYARGWTGNIYIVTQHGQTPVWLRPHPRIRVVDLRSLVTAQEAANYLPTFNRFPL